MTRGTPFYLGAPSAYELNMRLLDDMASAPSAPIEAIAAAPLVDAPLDPLGPYIHGEDLNNYMPPQPLIEAPLIDAAVADLVAIPDAASHAVIDGPASAQCSC